MSWNTRVALASFALAGVLVLYVAWPETEALASSPASLHVAGEVVRADPAQLRSLALSLGRAYLRKPITLRIDDTERTFTRATLGGQVDAGRLEALLGAALEARSPLRRVHAQLFGSGALNLPMPVELDEPRALSALLKLRDEVDRAPVDAKYDSSTGRVSDERAGRRLDVYRTLDAIRVALRDGAPTVDAFVEPIPALRTRASLGHVAAGELLGSFETRFDYSLKARNRAFNLAIAASKIDGIVLRPDEIFDFNQVVGERSEANGFRVATVIAEGELVDGIGGGTCQIAGTLHAAVFFAGLPILERRPHTRPSGYIKLGLDAVVSYPNLNLRFRNDLPFPIVISYKAEAGVARVEIRGAQRSRMVTFVRRVDEVLPFTERITQDPELPSGVRVISQRGIPGFKIRRGRIVRDVLSNQAVRQRMQDLYPPTAQIIRVGTGGPAPAGFTPPPGDSHPEYLADEYLMMTQGPGIEGIQETRRPGTTGVSGWTQRHARR